MTKAPFASIHPYVMWKIGYAGLLSAVLFLLTACENSPKPWESVDCQGVINEELCRRMGVVENTQTARNIILFIGDGMGVSTISAGRIYDGQSRGQSGEEYKTPLSRFPYSAMIKTYNTNQQVPDSAGTATAIHSGVRTRAGMLATAPAARRRNCAEALANRLPTILELAESAGKSTGIVTTTRVTHATPASTYAHLPERDWESDRFLPRADWELGCRDVAHQFVNFEFGDGPDIVLGGGSRAFLGSAYGGRRLSSDDDLIARWRERGDERRYITDRMELTGIGPEEQILGLFAESHLGYMAQRTPNTTEPTLSEMTKAAIARLEAAPQGYYLLVEGGKIDLGHHEGRAGYALSETQEFFRAIDMALGMVDIEDTLVIVTADHSHVFTMGGYPVRGNPILGLVRTNDVNGEPKANKDTAADGVPYTSLAYANGPGAIATDDSRPVPEVSVDAIQQSTVPMTWVGIDGSVVNVETHGGEDVALFALGPWAHLFGGIMEQDTIFHVMSFAFGWTADRQHDSG